MKLKSAVMALAASLALMAAEPSLAFGWPQDLDTAHESAIKEHKPILVLVYRDGCPACENVISRISKNRFLQEQIKQYEYVALSVEEAAQKGLTATRTPTFYFLSPDGENIADPLQGAPKDDYAFLDYLTQIELAYRQRR